MKHKKFVKQLMSVGVPRNTAELTATASAQAGNSLHYSLVYLLEVRTTLSRMPYWLQTEIFNGALLDAIALWRWRH